MFQSSDLLSPLLRVDPAESVSDKSLVEESSSVELVIGYEEFSQKDMKKSAKVPDHISLILSETNTFFILDLPSSTALKHSEEGDIVEEENKQYEYLTKGKGRNRKTINVEVQTLPILKKSRNTLPEVVKKKNNFAFSSNWEMFDTYRKKDVKREQHQMYDDDDTGGESDEGQVHQLDDIDSVESYRMSFDEKQLSKLMKNQKFLEAACVIERLLANNCYNEQQKRFRGLSDPEDLRENIEYKYRLNLLWTFANDTTKGCCVSALDWNHANTDLVAVGYGKFFFHENSPGMLMIWNIKNPVQPERQLSFVHPVTTLKFSKKDPNLLAVGFYNGHVIVLNIASRDSQVIAENIPSFEPVWHVSWHFGQDQKKDVEHLFATSDDGRVFVYHLINSRQLECQQIMRVAKADGKLKGYDTLRKCSNLSIPTSRYAAAKFLRLHPIDPNSYFIGTNEGVVHKCSMNYLNQHLDLFLAHEGPINELKYSPFSNKIYATCGDDWFLRIWAEGIAEPLHELYRSMSALQGMDWSPTHSTILATIFGKTILLWDFQRKVYEPQSVTESPTNSRNTVVQFIQSGRCLVVGDIDGNVHVFSLEDMPFSAFFQENLLFQAMTKSLITKPKLLQKLKKLRRLSTTSF